MLNRNFRNLLAGCVLVLIACTGFSAFAATDVTGTWTSEMKMPDGSTFSLTFVFKQDGTKLTGTVQGSQGDPLTIENGKVEGDKLSFTVMFNGTTITHDGTVNGDEIKLMTKADQPDFPGGGMTLKRSK